MDTTDVPVSTEKTMDTTGRRPIRQRSPPKKGGPSFPRPDVPVPISLEDSLLEGSLLEGSLVEESRGQTAEDMDQRCSCVYRKDWDR